MERFYQITISILIFCLVLSRIQICQESPKIITTEHTEYFPVYYPGEAIRDTVTKNNIVYKPVFFNGNEVHDTIYRDGLPIAITPEEYCSENLNFTAQSSRQIFKSGDSLTAKFTYPQMIFDFDYHAKPDTNTVKTITNTITKEPSRFGVYVGGGASIGMDGIVKPGINVSIGYLIY
jgi:hypothetical protein